MVTTPSSLLDEDLLYPSSDGQSMAENTKQYRWIVLIKENLEILFRNQPDVFIAGDLLWYPISVMEPPAPCQAPDVMVVFGRPKGDRPSYKQWEENNIAPQIAFEILSPSNRTVKGRAQMAEKLTFYERYGIEEYYIYDPDKLTLVGYLRSNNKLVPIPTMSNWVSPRLGIHFDWQPKQDLIIYDPMGDRFLSPLEINAKAQRSEAEAAKHKAEALRHKAEALRNKSEASQFKARADDAEYQLVGIQIENAKRLLAVGMPIAQIAEVLNLSLEELRDLE